MLIIIAVALIVAFLSMQFSSMNTTIYLHRTMAHKGLRLHPVVTFLMRFQLWLFTGIVTREWVAVHRKHHHFADQEGDPHSPHLKGLWNVLLWNAYYYSRECAKPDVVEKYTRDIPASFGDRMLNRGWLGLAFGVTLFAAGFNLFHHGWIAPVIGVVTFLVQAMAYIGMNAVINGACHVLGYKNFDNTATNLRSVAWFSGGEGLHNNHHQYPASAKFSMRRWEFDPAWPVIRVLSALSLAQPLPLPQES
ncbi:MAG TPA: fatty acid desaturase [Terriglobales bacterium]|jgi:stearoyl-CoA desaturase (delta-9 desaturase)|nr:fatty acid desaturase [Terriglobales bacterium]